MKNTISCLVLLFWIIGITAQEINTTNHTTQDNEKVATTTKKTANTDTDIASQQETVIEDAVISEEDYTCYSEISKITFYKALIRKNNLDISLKNKAITLKNTGDTINTKGRISYSE